MNKNKGIILGILFITTIGIVLFSGCINEEKSKISINETSGIENNYKIITDMRGKEVKIPKNPQRVVDMSDGFTSGVMTILGENDKIIGLGSQSVRKNYSYTYPVISGKNYTYSGGKNPAGCLNPQFDNLSILITGKAINYEVLASLEPDLIIMRLGDCCTPAKGDALDKAINTIDSLGIPLVVLRGDPDYATPDISNISKEIRIIGQIFDKEDKALEVTNYLDSIVKMIKERTKDIPESEKPNVLIFGLSSTARNAGAVGTTQGADTIESYFIEKIVNAKNAYRGSGSLLSAEQVYASNPDVIILPTANGYHPPSELYTAPYYVKMQELKAVKNRKVSALPWTPSNCGKRVEYPIEIMMIAKASYPEKFQDVKIHEWVLEFYQKVYGVDKDTAIKLRSAQWLDWTVEEDV